MVNKTLRTALAVGVLALASGYATQASAAPSFTFTEYGGFANMVAAIYTNPVVGAATVIPAVTPVYGTMSWNPLETPLSSLNLSTVTGPAALPFATWTTISTLTHNNIVIPTATNWGPQDIWGRFIVTDGDGTSSVRLDSDAAIRIQFTETPNATPCPGSNPNNTICDDFFAFTDVGLGDLPFTANDGSSWLAEFRFANLINAILDGNTVYTAEAQSSQLDVQVRISQINQVPEPATLSLLGLGLLGLGFAKRRQLKG